MKITLLAIVLALSILLLWTDPIEGRGGRGGGGRGGSGRGGSGRGGSGRGGSGRGGSGRGGGTGTNTVFFEGDSFGFNGNNSNSTLPGVVTVGIIMGATLGPFGIVILGLFIWLYCIPKWQSFKLKLKRKYKKTKIWLRSKFCCHIRFRLTQKSATTEEAPPPYKNYSV